jgi:hypothetical protein
VTAPIVLPWPLQSGLEAATRALLDPGDRSSVDFSRPIGEAALVSPDSVSWRLFKNGRADGGNGGGGGALGGAIFHHDGTVVVHNSTFFNNFVARCVAGGIKGGDAGGAIFSFDNTLEVANSTFSPAPEAPLTPPQLGLRLRLRSIR